MTATMWCGCRCRYRAAGNHFFHLIADRLCFRTDDNLNGLLIQFHHPGRAETFTGGIVHLRRIAHGQTQTGNTGINRFQVIGTANCCNVVGCQLSQTFFSVAVRFFSNDIVFFIFTARRFQVKHTNNRAEQHKVHDEEHQAHHDQHPDVLTRRRQVVHQHVVDSTCGEGEARVDPQQCCNEQADTR